ncbi:MAG: NYN domain-containing protein [Candidatus Dojkabacteria bacterium]|jgi:uncharacterized LabA/DUF88 family protein|nr:NYN domain-containing protein [Candidatus Dojkabacteria bacterium]
MPKKQRVKIFIDGSNFFFYCKELGIPTFPKFDFEKFINFLLEDRELVQKNYYIGAIRAKEDDKKALKMMANQMSFFSYLKKYNWKINKGYLLKSNDKYHEKGVDVKLALDLVLGAVDNQYDIALLLSSDTDILPAVEQVHMRKKKVEYIGFAHRPSIAMISNSKTKKLLTKSDLKKFVIK